MTIRGVVEVAQIGARAVSGCTAGLVLSALLILPSELNATAAAQDPPDGVDGATAAVRPEAPDPASEAAPAALEGASDSEAPAPVDFDTRWSRARSILVGGGLEEAERRLRILTEEEPLRVEPWLDLLHVLILTDRSLEAYRVASHVEALAPGHPHVALVETAVATRIGDRAGAIRRLRIARQRRPEDAALRLAAGALRHRIDPLHVLSLPRAVAEESLAALSEADATRTIGVVLTVAGAVLMAGGVATLIGGALSALACAFSGCATDLAFFGLGAGFLGAIAVGVWVAGGLSFADARQRRRTAMAGITATREVAEQP